MSQAGMISVSSGGGAVTSVTGISPILVNGMSGVPETGAVTITFSGGASNYTNVTFADSPYTVVPTDYYISVDCSGGPVTLNFPDAPTFKQEWVVKDRTGSSGTNNITITTPGGTVTFDGSTTYLLDDMYEAAQLIANATPTYEIF